MLSPLSLLVVILCVTVAFRVAVLFLLKNSISSCNTTAREIIGLASLPESGSAVAELKSLFVFSADGLSPNCQLLRSRFYFAIVLSQFCYCIQSSSNLIARSKMPCSGIKTFFWYHHLNLRCFAKLGVTHDDYATDIAAAHVGTSTEPGNL